MDKLCLPRAGGSVCWLAIPGRCLKAVVQLIDTWQARSHNREVMARMDPRLAKDIGLTRRDLQREIAKPFWRE